MRKLCNPILILLFIFSFFQSCTEDEGNTASPPNNSTNNQIPDYGDFSTFWGNSVQRDFYGVITDSGDSPVSEVTVLIGNSSVQTDENGFFLLRNVQVNERFAYLKANKTGYFQGLRTILPDSNGATFVQLKLAEKILTGTVSSTGGTVSLGNSQVTFGAGFELSNGTEYTGTVNVYMNQISADDNDLEQTYPGLYAQNSSNQERTLETFGMVNVQLETTDGQALQLTNANEATIRFPITSSQFSSAPSTIDLWVFDEENGYWVEDGSATREGDFYVGNVQHFSWWNCDIQFPLADLCLNFVDQNNNPIGGMEVKLTPTDESFGSTRKYSNSSRFCGQVIADQVFEVEIVFGDQVDCIEPISLGTIGPFSEGTSNELTLTLDFDASDIYLFGLEGTFLQCDGTPVTDGYIFANNQVVLLNNDGAFEYNVISCENENRMLQIVGEDFANQQSTDLFNFTLLPNVPTNAGEISACNDVEELIRLQIDGGEEFTFQGEQISNSFPVEGQLFVRGNSDFGTFDFLDFDDLIPSTSGAGTYNGIGYNINIQGTNYGQQSPGFMSETVVTSYGENSGDVVELTFTVTTDTNTITGELRTIIE